jgi:hypothetical protein
MNKCIHLKALYSEGGSFHVIQDHYLIAATHARSSAHRLTYQPKAGLRKYVIAKLYQQASEEMRSSSSNESLRLSETSLEMFTSPQSPVPPSGPSLQSSSPSDQLLLALKKFLSFSQQKAPNDLLSEESLGSLVSPCSNLALRHC